MRNLQLQTPHIPLYYIHLDFGKHVIWQSIAQTMLIKTAVGFNYHMLSSRLLTDLK